MMDSSTCMESMSEDSNDDSNKLEMTRNPFDSHLYEKENFPQLDASVFVNSGRTPEEHKSPSSGGGFRWSIDQIAKMQPADLDTFPNQEYSIM